VNEVSATSFSGHDAGSDALMAVEVEVDRLDQIRLGIQDEIDACKDDLAAYLKDLDDAQNSNQLLKDQLDKSTKSVKEYRMTLAKLKQTADEVNKNRQQLYDRGQKLADIITKLQLTKNDNDKAGRKLEEAFSDHQQLIASYHLLEDRIKEQEKQQETALGKMIEAVELAEEAAADAQKNRMTRDGLSEELKRIKELIGSTVRDFESAFHDHERGMKSHFEGIVGAIRGRSNSLESENERLGHEKSSLQRQLETATQENTILKAAKADTGFSHFIENMAALKAEIEAAYSKREQYIALNEKLQETINDVKGKLLAVGSDAKSIQVELGQKAQKLELDLEMQKSVCKDLLERNAKLAAENQSVRNDIVHAKRAADKEVRNRLKNKDSEMAEVKMQIEINQKATAKAISEMQQAVLAFREHADKWKFKAQSIGIEAGDARQNADGVKQQVIDQIHGLEEDLKQRKQVKAKCDLMLQQLNDQIKTLKEGIAVASKKQRAQATTITSLINQQNAYTAERGKFQMLLDKLGMKVKRKQRALEAVPRGYDSGLVGDSF
jgi:chromosome segregation ATPase